MPHFECGAFNRSATSPEPEKSLKKPDLGGCYLTKRAKTDKRQTGLWRRIFCAVHETRPQTGTTMLDALNFDRIRKEMRGILLTLCMVAAVTTLIYTLIVEAELGHGSVAYIIPVVIAATRWGIVQAIVAAVCGVLASAFFFYPPLYTFRVTDPHEVLNLILFTFVAVVVSQLATRLKRQLETARQREIDLRDLYAFSRRLAVAFDVSDIHAAIEDHLATVIQRKVVLFASARETSGSGGRRTSVAMPEQVLARVTDVASGRDNTQGGVTVVTDSGAIWLIRAVSPKSSEFGVIAVNLGRESLEGSNELRIRVDAVLSDATATLERLGVAHAISEARMRAQTEQLREALIGSVSHELRTPLASILGAATVLSAAPALQGEKKLKALVHDGRDEAERLNNDIQNLLDASRISSDGIKPHIEWADPADIINSAVERCRQRMSARRFALDLPGDLPLVHVDPVLVQQALIQIFDNAVKYSPIGSKISVAARARDDRMIVSVSDEGAGLTATEQTKIWGRFARGDRHATTASGSGLGLWIASAFIAANGGKISAVSEGVGLGTSVAIELPVTQAAVTQMEGDADE
jgi:two-component system sensor histidine kinase KdpD